MKSYHEIVGDGGSNIAGQVLEQRDKIAKALSGVRHRVAIGSGKGGVGKSTVTRALAAVLASRGHSVAILDADFNGPTQARMGGLSGAVPVPGDRGITLPRGKDGVGLFSVGAMLPETETVPASGFTRPIATRMSVLFPAPFSPSSACTLPRLTTKLTSSSATTAPKRLPTPRNSSAAGSMGPIGPAVVTAP